MVYTWDSLQQYHFNAPIGRLRRSPKIKKRYDGYLKQTEQDGITIGDVIKQKFFDDPDYTPFFAMVPNDFPYNVAPGIHHFILWFNPDNKFDLYDDYDYVAKVLDIRLGPGRYICFMNPEAIQSVPQIKHYHVFFR